VTEPIDFDTIGQLGRALFAQLAPMSGSRATGTATLTNETGSDVDVPAGTYLRPNVGGEAREHRLYKVAPNPATISSGTIASGQWCGGEWTIPASGSGSVSVQSNVGGAHQNLPAGSSFRFLRPVTGIAAAATLDAAITNGTNSSILVGPALLTRFVFWEQLTAGQSASEFFRAGAGSFPALLLVWTQSQTLQGRTSGGKQGSTRLARGDRAFRESFTAYIGTGLVGSAEQRREQGLVAMQTATRLLTDRQNNRDMEPLSTMGAGVEITNRSLAVAGQSHFIYSFEFELNTVLSKLEERTFGDWDVNAIQAKLPAGEAPEPTTPLTIVDVADDMS